MKNRIKRIIAVLLAVVMVLCAVPAAGFSGLDLSGVADWFSTTAMAAREGYLEYEVENGEATITDCDAWISGELVIPSMLGGYPVTSIGISAFYNYTGITSVTIPDSVTSIGDWAFSHCTGLTSITIPDSVTSIGDYTFYGCTGITSVTIPDSVTSIGSGAFGYCEGLTSVTIPNSVTSIGGSAFYYCTGLTSITIPDSVTSIGYGAFSYCTGLTQMSVSSGNNIYHSKDNCIIETASKELISGCKASVIPTDGSVTRVGMRAFDGCTDLTSAIIPDSVTNIGESAFSNCINLASVKIGNSVTSIGDAAFYDCSALTSITIPNSVTDIGDETFRCCTILSSVTIPNSVKNIGDCAFSQCNLLESITIPDGVVSIGSYAFEITSLTSIKIPGSVTYIGVGAFSSCRSLADMSVASSNSVYHSNGNCIIKTESKELISACNFSIIPSDGSVTSIGECAFLDCTKLTELNIPDSITNIGGYAFSNCIGLTSVTIPNSTTSIGEGAFYRCTELTSITIPKGVKNIEKCAFGYCDIDVDTPEKCADFTIYGYTGTAAEIYANENEFNFVVICPHNEEFLKEIPAISETCTTNGYTAGIYCTKCNKYISGHDLIKAHHVDKNNDRVCDICGSKPIVYSGKCGENAIYEIYSEGTCIISGTGKIDTSYMSCSFNDFDITKVVVEDGIANIDDLAFGYCQRLTSITIPDSVTSIGNDAFIGCTGLTEITIPNSVTNIGSYAFSGCTGLTSITIPDSVTSISQSMFEGCTGLTEITIPSSVTSIDSYAFEHCTGLTSITIPDSVTSIGDGVFRYCSGLKSVIIGNGVTDMGEDVFDDCTELTDLVIGNGITSIENNAFSGFANLTNVTIGSSVESIGDCAFCDCTSLKSITLPDSVTSIGYGAFVNCIELANIEISKNISDIGEAAFANCINLKVVKLPKSIKTIGEYAFGYYYDEENDAIAKVPDFVIHGFTGTVAESYANKNGFVFAPHTEKEIKDEKTGITIIIPGTYGKDVELNVVPVTSGEVSDALNSEKSNFKKSLFDITTTIDGEAVQPDGTVLVKIPLPEGYNPEKTVVYHVSDDGKLERLESSIADGYVVFETTHFSYYAIVDETEQKEPEQPPQPDPSATCTHICHKGGISAFFYKIARFFWKLFKTNKYCSCGAAHY